MAISIAGAALRYLGEWQIGVGWAIGTGRHGVEEVDENKERYMIYIYIDSNIFDYVYVHGINLSDEFPAGEYEIRIVGEQVLESRAIPEGKGWLKEYIYKVIEIWNIKTDKLFGFYDPRHTAEEQRVGGFNVGRYASLSEVEFISEQRKTGELEKRKSGLYPDETDISLGARAMGGSIVLTLDAKKGPLRTAKERGAPVVFLTEFSNSGKSLHDFVIDAACSDSHS
jgi:hypothetical protein